MTRTIALSLVLVMSIPLAACATERGDGDASEPPCCAGADRPACATSTPAVVSPAAAPPSSEPVVRFPAKHEGWTLADMFKHVTETTGQPILYDDTIATSKATVIICFTGSGAIKESDLFEFLQAVISYRKLTLVPVGPGAAGGKGPWFVIDYGSGTCRPVYIHESDVLRYADREGLYIVTTLSLADTVDMDRARDALSLLSTTTDGIGRIRDTGPGGRTLIVGDFAPVVASMKRLVDRINAESEQ